MSTRDAPPGIAKVSKGRLIEATLCVARGSQMSGTNSSFHTVLLGVVAVGATALLSGCFSPPVTPIETPEPEPTEEAALGGDQQIQLEPGSIEPPAADPGYTVVIDDLHLISIEVPTGWTEVEGAPYTAEGDQEWASLSASSDLDAYFSGYEVSGMEYASTRLPDDVDETDLKAFLDSVTDYLIRDCQVQEQGNDYSDTVYTGYVSVFYDCAGVTDSWAFGVVAVDNARTHVVYVRATIAPEDDEQAIYTQLVYTFQSTIS